MTLSQLLPHLPQDTVRTLDRYCDLLLDENTRVNLTAITERDAVYIKHIADSLAAVQYLPEGARIVDVGCGAGLPGIPLKIVRNDLDVTLLDSVNKKVSFCNRAVAELGLTGIAAHHTRIEDWKTRDYDYCVARAVSRLNTLAEYALPLLRVGGTLISYKANDVEAELDEAQNALRVLGGTISDVITLELDSETRRKLVFVTKTRPTPATYPRPRNLPRTKPL